MPYGYIGVDTPNQAVFNSGVFSITDVLELEKAGKFGGSLEIIESVTISSAVAYVDFLDLKDYKTHIFNITGFASASDFGAVSMRVSNDGGTSFETTSYNYCNQYTNYGNFGFQRSTTDNKLSNITPPNAGTYPNSANCRIIINGALDSSLMTQFIWNSTALISFNGNAEGYHGAGSYAVNETINALRIFTQNSSNIQQGILTLYGLKETI